MPLTLFYGRDSPEAPAYSRSGGGSLFMEKANKRWLERQRERKPEDGFVWGRDTPEQAFHVAAYTWVQGKRPKRTGLLPKSLDFMALWRAHLELVPDGDPNDGLSAAEIDVLMNSDDDKREVQVTIFGTASTYNAQRTKKTAVAKRLQAIGLVHILEYLGPTITGPDGQPLGLKGCVFAWTPYGIKWVQLRLGIGTNDPAALYLAPSVTDVNRYG